MSNHDAEETRPEPTRAVVASQQLLDQRSQHGGIQTIALDYVGDNIDYDVTTPITHGMRAALVRPHGLQAGEIPPDGALLLRHVSDLPALLGTA